MESPRVLTQAMIVIFDPSLPVLPTTDLLLRLAMTGVCWNCWPVSSQFHIFSVFFLEIKIYNHSRYSRPHNYLAFLHVLCSFWPGVHRGKGRTTHYTLSEAVYWDFASSSKISLWRRFVCLITLDLWFIQTSLMRKHVIFFHCPGSWENLVNVCNTILVSHTERITIVCKKKKRFLGKLFCSFR